MFSDNARPYKGTRPADLRADESSGSTGYADYITDGVYFLLAVAISVSVTYLAVILFRPDVWMSL